MLKVGGRGKCFAGCLENQQSQVRGTGEMAHCESQVGGDRRGAPQLSAENAAEHAEEICSSW